MESDQDDLDHGPDDRDKDIDTQVPDAAVINMKANFVLPEVTDLPSQVAFLDFFLSIFLSIFLQAEEDFFSTVVYTELAPLETAMIVSQV